MIRSVTVFLTLPILAFAQPVELDMEVFSARRARFMERIEQGSTAIFASKPQYMRNLDVAYDYRQESNFYYLSGYEEPESILLLNPSASRYKYVMFVRKRDQRHETYEGPRSGAEGAMLRYRADTALTYDDFQTAIHRFISHNGALYYTFGINLAVDEIIRKICIEARSGSNCPIIEPAPILADMRLIKNEGDWKMGLQKAVDISVQAHIEAIKAIRPGMYEHEVQAIFEYVYRRNGSPRNGYPCIIGSGPNSGTLHYSQNTRKLLAPDVVLMDCAAEYGMYTADITRTVPVDGTFSEEQRAVYDIVLDAQTKAMNMVKPGIRMSQLDSVISGVLGKGLKDLGFIKEEQDFRIFTLHGYCHWIGLDVHDVGGYTEGGKSVSLRPGMVFTIEPGIYVRPEVFSSMKHRGYSDEEITEFRKRVEPFVHIGVRIEDDVLVTDTGYRNLSEKVPRSIDELEELMRED
jgi:Xaa-Pro aminopeptidase